MADKLKIDTVPNQTYSDCQTRHNCSPKYQRGYCRRKATSKGNTSIAKSVSAIHKVMKKTLLAFLSELFLKKTTKTKELPTRVKALFSNVKDIPRHLNQKESDFSFGDENTTDLLVTEEFAMTCEQPTSKLFLISA